MVWRPTSPRPNPLHALQRVVERDDPPVGGESPTDDRVHVVPSPSGGIGADTPPVASASPEDVVGELTVAANIAAAAAATGEAAVTTVAAATGEAAVTTVVAVAVKERRHGHARVRTVPRPASDPEPSHREPERSPRAVITSTPSGEADTEWAITPLPATYAVDEPPPGWWLARRSSGIRPKTAPDLRKIASAPGPQRVMGFAQVLTVIAMCLGLWTLIDAPALARSAAEGPLGTRRTVALDVLHPIARASAWLGLDRVDHVAESLLHRSKPTAKVTALPPALPVVPLPHPTVTPAHPVTLRVPTAANPLRVLVVGDSLGLTFGQGLANKLDATGVVKTTVDAREGTGLARPDAFDWIAQLRADIVRSHPEVVVVSFGGNDDQDVQVGGRFILFNNGPWQAIYAARVQQVMATVRTANAELVWSGLPVVRSSAKTTRLMAVMDVTRAALAAHDGVLFVDNRATLADAGGHYVTAMPDASGNAVLVRQPDGIHETPAGADRLAAKAIAAMTSTWHLTLP